MAYQIDNDEDYYNIVEQGWPPMTAEDVAALGEMFSSRGWKLLMDIQRKEMSIAKNEGLSESLTMTEGTRARARTIYHCHKRLVNFQQTLCDDIKSNPETVKGSVLRENLGLDMIDI